MIGHTQQSVHSDSNMIMRPGRATEEVGRNLYSSAGELRDVWPFRKKH